MRIHGFEVLKSRPDQDDDPGDVGMQTPIDVEVDEWINPSGRGLALDVQPESEPVSRLSSIYRFHEGTVTGAGYSSVSDILGVTTQLLQGTDNVRPIRIVNNGRNVPSFATKVMTKPLNYNLTNWGLATWIKPNTVSGTRSIYVINTSAGGASVVVLTCSQSNAQLILNVQETVGTARRYITTDTNVLTVNVPAFVFFGFRGDQALEPDRAVVYVNASKIAGTFAANPTAVTMPSALISATGLAWIGAANAAGGSGFSGELGTNMYEFNNWDPTTIQAELTELMTVEPLT